MIDVLRKNPVRCYKNRKNKAITKVTVTVT